jgi:hypothetical protein
MRYIILSLVSLIISEFSFCQNLDIKIKTDTCIDASIENKIIFVIENNNDFDYWIKTEYLTFYFGVYTLKGEPVQRRTTRHLNRIGKNEYTLIDKNSKVTVEWITDFFDNYRFKFNHDYYIQTSYEYIHMTREEKKKSKKPNFKLIQAKIDAKSNQFKTCNL